MQILKRALPIKEESLRINKDYYERFNAYEHDLLCLRNEYWFYTQGLRHGLIFMEESLGKMNKNTCDLRKLVNEADMELTKLNEEIESQGINDKLLKALF